MTERKRYIRPEIHEVLLDVSQAVLAVCKSMETNNKQGNRGGWCKSGCKQGQTSSSSNSRAHS